MSKSNGKENPDICCICLNKQNESFNELVECDSCGFYVHEGCYGISDSSSKVSNDSIASTEPWFCNECLVRPIKNDSNTAPILQVMRNHYCELCPNTHLSLLKQTETSKFVHAICALYTPGVTYRDTDALWPIVLDEIAAKQWGEHACSLCENVMLSRTGICIKCDAGMCKTYFHVTCALKSGLLVNPYQQSETDPFIAYCKYHNDTHQISVRRANFNSMMRAKEKKSLDYQLKKLSDDERLITKFEQARANYELKQRNHFIYDSPYKIPRLMSTSTTAVKRLLDKTALDAANVQQANLCNTSHRSFSITFTKDFIEQYMNRELKIAEFNQNIIELKNTQKTLLGEEYKLKKYLDSHRAELNTLLDHNRELKQNAKRMRECLFSLIDDENKKKFKSLSNSISNEKSNSFDEIKQQAQVYELICSICKVEGNSHLLIDCDTCKLFFHISCLTPALPSLPKKGKNYGWECSSCFKKNEKNSDKTEETITREVKMNLNKPRSLRKPKRLVQD